jgi:disulfide bond formation protein DsbB
MAYGGLPEGSSGGCLLSLSHDHYKNIGAGIVGIAVGAVLAYATDYMLEAVGILPGDTLYVSWILGVIGFIVSMAGAIATWNMNLGPHWYAITLAVLAFPSAWLGGKWYQLRHAPKA